MTLFLHTCAHTQVFPSTLIITLDTNQCTTGNGGCDHTCTDLIPGRECSCDDGYVLESDGKTCSGE